MIWDMTTLAESGKWYSGGTPRTENPDFWNGTIPWISAASMHDFFIQKSDRCVTTLGVENGTRLVPKDTIIFVVRGMSLQNEFRIGITRTDVTFGQDCKALVANERFLPLFLAYYLRSQQYEVLGLVDEASHGTGKLPTEAISALEVPVPPLAEQRAIAGVLSSLDDKIDLLHRQNKTLESLAETLFRQWFVEEAEDDWDVRLGDVLATCSGGTPSRSRLDFYENGTISWVKSKELNGGFVITTEESISEAGLKSSAAKLLQENSVLIALYGATVGEYAILARPMTCNQAVCAVAPSVEYPFSFLFMYFKFMKDEIVNMAVGSAQQNISQILIRQLLLPRNTMVVKKFHETTSSHFEQIKANLYQIQSLEKLRDTLLPKMMSGEVRVEVSRG